MANPLDRVWSLLSDASNALGNAEPYPRKSPPYRDWQEINDYLDAVTRLVMARIEKDNRDFEER